MSRNQPATNNYGPLFWPAVVLIAGLFLSGCQGQRSMQCVADTTGTTAHAECTATEAGKLDAP